MEIVTRVQWDSRYAAGFGPAPTADEVYLHHSVMFSPGPNGTLSQDITAMHSIEGVGQARFGKGVSYTFIVMESGRVFEGTGAGRVGAHTAGRNTRSRAICLNGNYQTKTPNDRMVDAVVALLRYGEGRTGYWYRARLTGGHRDAPGAQTACPGAKAQALIPTINARAAAPADTTEPAPPEPVNMEAPDMFVAKYGSTRYRLVTGDRYVGGITEALAIALNKQGVPLVGVGDQDEKALAAALQSETAVVEVAPDVDETT